MTSQMVRWSVWTIWSAWSVFSVIFGFRGVNISKVKNPGKCHDLQRKYKIKKKLVSGLGKLLGGGGVYGVNKKMGISKMSRKLYNLQIK